MREGPGVPAEPRARVGFMKVANQRKAGFVPEGVDLGRRRVRYYAHVPGLDGFVARVLARVEADAFLEQLVGQVRRRDGNVVPPAD